MLDMHTDNLPPKKLTDVILALLAAQVIKMENRYSAGAASVDAATLVQKQIQLTLTRASNRHF